MSSSVFDSLPGAVGSPPEHYGNPLAEQKALAAGQAVVALSNRGVVTVTGPDRLSWLDSLTSQSLTVSLRLAELERPSVVAERLPKVLIHRNVPGERVHDFVEALDRHWQYNAALGAFGPSQRWIAVAKAMKHEGWPVRGPQSRWRLGELTVDWAAVAPSDFSWS